MKNSRVWLAVLVMLSVLLASVPVLAGGLDLLSMEEAKDLALDDAEWAQGAVPKAFSPLAPKIVFEAPSVADTENGLLINSPSNMNLLVVFTDGVAEVDMSTLVIKARKGWFSKNLTDRLQPYLQGTSLKAENVKIPTGRFKLEIKISDMDGHEAVQTYLCEIHD